MDRALAVIGVRARRGRGRRDPRHRHGRLLPPARAGVGAGWTLGRRRARSPLGSGRSGDVRAALPRRRDRLRRVGLAPKPRYRWSRGRGGRHRGRPPAECGQPCRRARRGARHRRVDDDRPGALPEPLRLGLRSTGLPRSGTGGPGTGPDSGRPGFSDCAGPCVGQDCRARHVRGRPSHRPKRSPEAFNGCPGSRERGERVRPRTGDPSAMASATLTVPALASRRDHGAVLALLAHRPALPECWRSPAYSSYSSSVL